MVIGAAAATQLPLASSYGSSPAGARPVAVATPSPTPAQQPPEQQPAASPTSTPGTTMLQRGSRLYGAGCAGCHGQRGEGSAQGPDLRDVGTASTDFQLSTGRMPLSRVVQQPQPGHPAYERSDIDALVAYVASLGGGGTPIPTVAVGDIRSGRELYIANCAACHSSSGVGAALPAGHVAPSLLDTAPTQVAEAARVGPGLMPPFSSSVLSDQQLDAVVTYVQSLSANQDHGGWPLGAVGPVTEGFIGWVVGLGALVVVIRLLGKKAP